MKKTLKGFTLIEMLIVIVIIGILAAVLIPKIGGAREQAQDVSTKANVRNLAQGVLQAQLQNFTVSSSTLTMERLLSGAMADKYNFNLITQNTGDYSVKVDGGKFIICGALKQGGGNSTTGAAGLDSGRNELSEGSFYCYKG